VRISPSELVQCSGVSEEMVSDLVREMHFSRELLFLEAGS
jgi:hypothetical protein